MSLIRQYVGASIPLVLVACGGPQQPVKETAPPLPSVPSLSVEAQPIDGEVEFTVKTNLPTPIAATASLDLQGLKDNDTAVGTSKDVILNAPVTNFAVKSVNDVNSLDGKPLPKGNYDASILVGPKWTQNTAISSLPSNIEAKQTVVLGGSRSAASVRQKDDLQRWAVDNVPSNEPWSAARFRAKLGPYSESPSTLSPLHDAYYFPQADMTLIVNRVRDEVSIWGTGNVKE